MKISKGAPLEDTETSIDEEKQQIEKVKSKSLSLSRFKSVASSKKSKKGTNLVREIYPEADLDNGLVGWDGQDDPLHPRNYPDNRKWTLLAIVSGITFLRYLTLSPSLHTLLYFMK